MEKASVSHETLSPIPSSHPERTVPRHSVALKGFVREKSRPIIPVEITNISTDGCRFLSEAAFETATVIWVKIEGLGAHRARIAWNKAEAYGCEFLSAIEFVVLDSFIERRAA